jgi:arylsulfatase
MPKGSILFLMTDEHRWDYMGYMGHRALRNLSPHLDRLAREGAIFTRCFSPNPLCMPARNAIHTGLYTFQSGQMNNVGDWPMHLPTFTQALRHMGYRTALIGKLHAHEAVGYDIDLADEQWDTEVHELGFDDVVQVAGKTMDFFTDDHYTRYLEERDLLYSYREDVVRRVEVGEFGLGAWPSVLPEEHYIDNFIGRKAVEWLEAYSDSRPFCLMVSFCSPHPSYDALASALRKVDRGEVVLPPNNDDPERLRELIANYVAQIHIVDANIGKIAEVLKRRGWTDQTLIVYTADHGEMLGDSNTFGKCMWEDGSVRVPTFIRYPSWTGPRVIDAIISCHDVAATMLHFAADQDIACECLPGCSSISLKPLLTGQAGSIRDVAYSENGGQFMRPWRMVDTGALRYVRLLDSNEELLFDLGSDPHCRHNSASQSGMVEIVHQLRQAMLAIFERHPAPKAGRAGYSPHAPHVITREGLARHR